MPKTDGYLSFVSCLANLFCIFKYSVHLEVFTCVLNDYFSFIYSGISPGFLSSKPDGPYSLMGNTNK